MAVIVQTREERVRYGQESKYIDQFSSFGWRYTSKKLLNRFGSPLPLGEKVSESDLVEKCFYQLSFRREIDESVASELDALQTRFNENLILDVSFGKGRIFWSIVLSLVFIAALVGIFSSRITTGATVALAILALLSFGGAAALISTGIIRVKRLYKRNDEVSAIQDDILLEARKILIKQKKNSL